MKNNIITKQDSKTIDATGRTLGRVASEVAMSLMGKTKPSFQPIPIKDIFREDVAKEPISQEKVLANTKHKENGYFKGPGAV